MNIYDAQEQAYKNGYRKGFEEALELIDKWVERYSIKQVLDFIAFKDEYLQKIEEH